MNKRIKHVYNDFQEMWDLRQQSQKYFNNRTLEQFINDSELRFIAYVPTKEEQDKENWQSNIVPPVTRQKIEALLASVALDVPQTRFKAVNERDEQDQQRAMIMKTLVTHSYNKDNKQEEYYFEGLETSVKGTGIVYDGYLKCSQKRKVIKSFDIETGKIETEEKEVETENRCVSTIVPLESLYIMDYTIRDIQDQPSLAWAEYMSKSEFNQAYGKYPKADKVKTGGYVFTSPEEERFFKERWTNRTSKDEPIEVLRYYNKPADEYMIVANGVLLLDVPMLLGKRKKWYPFAKTIYKAFASDFFYGNSLPNDIMGEHDAKASLFNMALDKTYKSMMDTLLIGMSNKDDFDLEDDNVTVDTRIYVQDISQVKNLPTSSLSDGEVKMMDIIGHDLDLSSSDSTQQGVSGKGVTAREIVIANENAQKMKGVFYMFLTHLWIQKMKLRSLNVLTYYTKPKVKQITGGEMDGEIESKHNKFMVPNSTMSDGGQGTMGIQMVGDDSELPSLEQLDISEAENQKKAGSNYEELAITSDYLDEWEYDVEIIAESIYQKDAVYTQAKLEDKLRMLTTLFPEVFAQNKDKLVRDTLWAYEDDPNAYNLTAPIPTMPTPQGMPTQEGKGTPAKPAEPSAINLQQ